MGKGIVTAWVVGIAAIIGIGIFVQAQRTEAPAPPTESASSLPTAPEVPLGHEDDDVQPTSPSTPPEDVTREPTAARVEEAPALIARVDSGTIVDFLGAVISVYAHPDGHTFLKVRIDRTGQEIDVPIFSSLGHDRQGLTRGSRLWIKGKVGVYKGNLQVVPDDVAHVRVLEGEAPERVEVVELRNITRADRGRIVQVRGFVRNASERSGHLFFRLEDGKGYDIKAVLFRADGSEIAGRKTRLTNAARERSAVRILATVDVYKDELEVIVDKVYNQE